MRNEYAQSEMRRIRKILIGVLCALVLLSCSFGIRTDAAVTSTSETTASATTRSGWFTPPSGRVYYYKAGKLLTGLHTIQNQKFYFNSKGLMQTGWQTISGKLYYFRKNATSTHHKGSMMISDWLKSGSNYYYLTATGVRASKLTKISGSYYYFRAKAETGHPVGTMVTGWFITSKYHYCFTTKGVMMTGFKNIGSSRYYFNSKGQAVKGTFKVSGTKYYAFSNYKLAIGWHTINKYRYYMDAKGAIQTGWQTIDSKKYYFSFGGVMQVSKWIDSTHYVGKDGAWIEGYEDPLNATFRWPLSSSWNYVSSYFGGRESPGGVGSTNHQGIDIPATTGTPIYAAASGTVVVKLGTASSGGFGNWIQINHGAGLISEYAHMSKFNEKISVGTKVTKGQIIGYVGSTGNSTGPHLHFGVVLNGSRVDPMKYTKKPS